MELTASRKALIRKAYSLEPGSTERKALLGELKKASTHPYDNTYQWASGTTLYLFGEFSYAGVGLENILALARSPKAKIEKMLAALGTRVDNWQAEAGSEPGNISVMGVANVHTNRRKAEAILRDSRWRKGGPPGLT